MPPIKSVIGACRASAYPLEADIYQRELMFAKGEKKPYDEDAVFSVAARWAAYALAIGSAA